MSILLLFYLKKTWKYLKIIQNLMRYICMIWRLMVVMVCLWRLEGLYNPGAEYHLPYFEHASCLLPGLRRMYPQCSGISHHMLFQYSVMQDLFSLVENLHQKPFWQAFCSCVHPEHLEYSGASEYEIYFNFVFSRTKQVHIRHLKWLNVNSLKDLARYQTQGYHYVSCHSFLRENND